MSCVGAEGKQKLKNMKLTQQQEEKAATFSATDIKPKQTDANYRYYLKYMEKGTLSTNTLYVVGLNPSTADMKTPDPTMSRLFRLCVLNGYDSFVMFNLYPHRATNPNEMDNPINSNEFNENIKFIKKKLPQGATVLLCYGNNIGKRSYLIDSLMKIRQIGEKKKVNWKCISESNLGFPSHPIGEEYDLFKNYQFN